MGKTIAVYYCGGCNPRYDRVAAVRALEARFPAVRFVLPDAGVCQGALAVCGCTAGCAARRVAAGVPRYVLRNAGELAEAARWLEAFETT